MSDKQVKVEIKEEYEASTDGVMNTDITSNMLEKVNEAIMAITVGGQSYKIGSRSLTRADLKQLYSMRNDLIAQKAAENTSGLFDDCYVGVFDGR